MCSVNFGMPNKRIIVAYDCRYMSALEWKQWTQALEQLFAGANAVVIAGNFTHPWIEWDKESFPRSAAENMFTRWLEDRVVTQRVREDTCFRSDKHPSVLNLIINRHDNDVPSLCCCT